MCFLAIDNGNVYVVSSGDKELSDTIILDWKNSHRERVTYNIVLYDKIYRQRLGLPSDISLDDELKLLHDRYGVPLYDNNKFLEAMSEVKREYDKAKRESSHFVTWATERGCTVEETDRVLYV